MSVRRLLLFLAVLITCYVIFLLGSYNKESQIIYSDFNDSFRVNIYREGFIIGGYDAILEVTHNHNSETKKQKLFLFYDSPHDWRGFLKSANLKSDNLTITLTPALFAFQKKLSLVTEKTINMEGLVVQINFPTKEDIEAYEGKFSAP